MKKQIVVDTAEDECAEACTLIRLFPATMKYYDPVVEEVRARGRQLTLRYGNDPKKIMAMLRERADAHVDKQVRQIHVVADTSP